MSSDRKLNFKTKFAFGLGAGGVSVINQLLLYYALFYFTDVSGISPAVAGTIILVARIWDAINDPMCGYIIDRTKTKKGKARPYLLWGAVPMALFLVLTFTTPNFGPIGRVIWVAFTYVGLGMALTVTFIAVLTLITRLTTNAVERVKLSSAYLVGGTGVTLVVTSLWMTMIEKFGNGNLAKGYQTTAIIVGVLCGALVLITYFFTEEISVDEDENAPKVGLGTALKAAFGNSQFLIIAAVALVIGIENGLVESAYVYYLTYNLGREDLMGLIIPLSIGFMLIASLTAGPIAKKVSKKTGIIVSFAVIVVVYLIRLVTHDASITFLVASFAIVGICTGYFNVLLLSILTDCMDYGELKTGITNEGLIMSAFTFQQKLGMGVGSAVLGFILENSGYVESAAQQSESALKALFNCSVTIALVTYVACMVPLFFYKLTEKKMEEVRAELEQRKATEQ